MLRRNSLDSATRAVAHGASRSGKVNVTPWTAQQQRGMHDSQCTAAGFLAHYTPAVGVCDPTLKLIASSPRFRADFQKCYAGADSPQQCVLQKEDYLECLHHTKEVRPIDLRWAIPLAPLPCYLFLQRADMSLLSPAQTFTQIPSRRSVDNTQVSRALRIKSQYLSKTAHELAQKRQEVNQQADTGIMGLGLLTTGGDSNGGGSGSDSGKEDSAKA